MNVSNVRNANIAMMRRTLLIWENILAEVSQETATTYRDGGDGWTVLETLCHVRDFDGFFFGRAVMMREEETPQLPAYDHDAIAIESRYNEQDLVTALNDLKTSRERFATFFESLSDAEWERAGIHPERGYFTMMDAAIQVVSHDLTHIEQITHILKDKLT